MYPSTHPIQQTDRRAAPLRVRGNAVSIATAVAIIATLPFFGVVTFLTAVRA